MWLRRRHSRAVRVFRLLTAFLTVWCLGCTAFDPLLTRLAGGDASSGMTCGDDAVRPATSTASATISVAPDHRGDGYDCGCRFCHAPEVASPLATLPARDVPRVTPAEPNALASVAREPLLPPPQRAL